MPDAPDSGQEPGTPPRLLLIDGHALVYRAFYALQNERPLTNARGELTTGVFGFTNMLLKALELLRPTYVVAAFDTSAPTYRTAEFEAYKGTRKAAPPGLSAQVRLSRDLLESMQVPIFRLEGYEADDLIGTLACQAEAAGVDVVILSGDNDLLQLVTPHVKVLTSRRGISDTILYDVDAVREKYGGLEPPRVVDFKALRGDVSDNIPSVAGIGDKTAQKLLLDHGTVERLYDGLDRVPDKQRALLEPAREQVLMAKRLATIQCDAPVALDLDAARLSDLRRPEVIASFHDLAFKSLIDRLPRATPDGASAGQPLPATAAGQLGLFGESPAQRANGAAGAGQVLTTSEAVADFVAAVREHGSFAFNVQATGTLPMAANVVGLGLAAGDRAAYLPLVAPEGPTLDLASTLDPLRTLFADPEIDKHAHNAKFHMILLARLGLPVGDLAFDTMVAAYLLESGQRALALRDLAWAKLQVEVPSVASLLGTGKKAITMAQLPAAECGAYACQEAQMVERLAPMLEAELEAAGQSALFRNIELPLVPVLAAMEVAGIAVDVPYLQGLGRELQERLAALEQTINAHAGHPFNIGSTQQLSKVLFEELQLQAKTRRARTKSGHQSTGVEVLEELRDVHPIVPAILEHRQLQKLASTYVDALLALVNPATGRVHTTFNQTVAATGRLSSSDPNLQNIPVRTEVGRRVRRAFVAREGEQFLSLDYSQIELRILAHMTEDPTLLEAFTAGDDPHAATAAEVMGVPLERVTSNDRRVAKMVNYGVLYGMSEFGLADRTDLPPAEAGAFIQRYFERFGTVKRFQDQVIRDTEQRGYAETLLGRRRYIPEIRSPIFGVRQAAIRAAINAPIQGTASDIVKIAMIAVQAYLERAAPNVKMLLQVHDELLLEGPEATLTRVAPDVARLMEEAMVLKARLHVDLKLGPNWEDMHPLSVEDQAASRA